MSIVVGDEIENVTEAKREHELPRFVQDLEPLMVEGATREDVCSHDPTSTFDGLDPDLIDVSQLNAKRVSYYACRRCHVEVI